LNNLQTTGAIRFSGNISDYPTLLLAQKNGMQLSFLSNDEYDFKHKNILTEADKSIYWIPSGGHTQLGIHGCEEILQLYCLKNIVSNFTHIVVPVGNGTTLAGISNSCLAHQKIIAIPALKNANYLIDELNPFIKNENIDWWFDYHFGGFGKSNSELFAFINFANKELQLPLDKVYTAKMLHGILDKIAVNYFEPSSSILMIHTGGLQGNG
jgi:1-aminocyclopropane-1-carboxylate deaminase